MHQDPQGLLKGICVDPIGESLRWDQAFAGRCGVL